MDLLYWSRHFRNMLGEGDLEVTRFMQAVIATGYDGPISLEIFNDLFRGGNTVGLARDGYRSLVNLMDQVQRAEPALLPTATPLATPQNPQGFAFVEFATRGDEAAALEKHLHALGFEQTGKHRNKAVSLWQQGDIRLVLNQETSGHAATSWTVRGTNVCDIGLQVTDAQAAIARATQLGDTAFGQPLGPGETDVPAIRGLAGSVMHLVDDTGPLGGLWKAEFDARRTAPSQGLTRIDHIAQTMSYDEMLSWSLFYTTLFEMQKSPMMDVIDPDGLVRSQAVQTPGGALRVTLNGADTHRTLAGSFLADSFGASVQHIAFATDDIFETLRMLEERGFEALPIPDNYYADLAARFDLPSGLLKRMQASSVLYDEEPNGQFFQCYSRMTDFGFFFEIVQRAPGYGGYGGPNAPFRIAAQKRLGRPKGMPLA